jgi:hypothetical protein
VAVDVEGQLPLGDKPLAAVVAGQVVGRVVILHVIVQSVLGLEQFTTLLALNKVPLMYNDNQNHGTGT